MLEHLVRLRGGETTSWWSSGSRWSALSVRSVASALCLWSIGSAGSIASIGSAGGIAVVGAPVTPGAGVQGLARALAVGALLGACHDAIRIPQRDVTPTA